MTRYTSPSLPSITPLYVSSGSPALDAAIADPNVATLGLPGDEGGAASFASDDAVSFSTADLKDQFFVFQLSTETTGPTRLESTQVDPSIQGGEDNPDVLAHVEMLSFHLGTG